MTPPILGPDDETMEPCEACSACTACKGTGRVTCYRCPLPHVMDCNFCDACGACDGTHLMTRKQIEQWRANHPEPPEAA